MEQARERRGAWLATLALVAATGIAPAEAALHKCKMPDGTFHYTDAPCPAAGARGDPTVTAPSAEPDPLRPRPAAADPPVPAPEAPPPTPEVAPDAAVPSAAAPEVTTVAAPAEATTAPDSGRELRTEPASRRAWDFIVWSGLIVSLVAGIFMLVHAWRHSNKWWIPAMLLLAPASIAYAAIKRDKGVWIALLLSWGCPLVSYAAFTPGVDLVWAEDGAVTRYQDPWPASSRARFRMNDTVKVVTSVRWYDKRAWDNTFIVGWVWYTDDEQVGEFQQFVRFEGNPYLLEAQVPAEELGAGSHRVEVYIDGELFQAEPFQIVY